MAKKVAVLVVNPVNGSGLFQYLETFFENGIPFRTFAVADTTNVKTNSGLRLQTDDVITSLKGHEHEYDALVFACGDAMPKFAENADKPYNVDMLSVIKNFAAQGKTIAGHCAAALLFDNLGIAQGRRVALHPFSSNRSSKAVSERTKKPSSTASSTRHRTRIRFPACCPNC